MLVRHPEMRAEDTLQVVFSDLCEATGDAMLMVDDWEFGGGNVLPSTLRVEKVTQSARMKINDVDTPVRLEPVTVYAKDDEGYKKLLKDTHAILPGHFGYPLSIEANRGTEPADEHPDFMIAQRFYGARVIKWRLGNAGISAAMQKTEPAGLSEFPSEVRLKELPAEDKTRLEICVNGIMSALKVIENLADRGDAREVLGSAYTTTVELPQPH